MTDTTDTLETLAQPLRDYLAEKAPVPTTGALVTFQAAYLKDAKRHRDKDLSHYAQLLDDVVARRNA